jgi:uncharacterized protein with HEPN domain
MSPADRIRLRHMRDACDAALRFANGRFRADLEADDQLLFALVHALEVIGEAAARVTPEGRAEADALPWSAIVGMRNRLVHAYFDINLDIVWTTVTTAVPTLQRQLFDLLGADAERIRGE